MTARVSHTTQSHQSQQGTNETTLSKAAAQLGQSFDMLCLEQRQQPEARNSDYVEAAAMPADASPAKPQPELIQEQPYVMQYDVYKLPLTLLDWRRAPINIDGTAKYLWEPFEPYFLQQGYSLFVPNPPEKRSLGLVPKCDGEVRAPDMFHVTYNGESISTSKPIPHHSNKCCPATRLRDGTHVMIQLVSKRSGGCSELAILKRFSRPDIASHPDNHVLPLLEEFNYLDMVFVAVPLLNENVVSPWYYDIKEVLDAVSQTFKGLAFMHEHLVAHLDIGCHDILHNYGGNAGRRQFTLACFKSSPFRSRLSGPCRYTFIDFELSAYFPYGFKPEQCKVIGMGLITAGRLTDADHYGKHLPPEWTKPEAYCPFRSDVYQIGQFWGQWLWEMKDLVPELFNILEDMVGDDPAARITMAKASSRLKAWSESLSDEFLATKVWEYCPDKQEHYSQSERERKLKMLDSPKESVS